MTGRYTGSYLQQCSGGEQMPRSFHISSDKSIFYSDPTYEACEKRKRTSSSICAAMGRTQQSLLVPISTAQTFKGEEHMSHEGQDFEQGASLTMAAIAAAKERLTWMKSTFGQDPKTRSWRITMEFDEGGDLLNCWEACLDRAGNELIRSGIGRVSEPFGFQPTRNEEEAGVLPRSRQAWKLKVGGD
jgi:hypothetical protein